VTVARLALRVLRGGGAAGLIRLALMIVGVSVGVAAVLFVATIPGALGRRAAVEGERLPSPTDDKSAALFRFQLLNDSWHGRILSRTLLAASTATAPPPPGVARFPSAGEAWVSPALATALRDDPDLTSRVPGRIAGTIGPDGLEGPDELVAYVGVSSNELGQEASLGDGWNGLLSVTTDANSQGSSVAFELALLIAVPAAGYLLICARLSAATRTRRYASLRLLGLRRAELLRVAMIESAIAGGLGAILGVGLYRAVNPLVADTGIAGFRWYPQETEVGTGGLVAAVVVVAIASSIVGSAAVARGLRRPMVARFDPDEMRARWWMAAPFVLGLALIAEPLLLQTNTPGHPQRPNSIRGALLLAGVVLTFAGLLLALKPILAGIAARISAGEAPAPIRIAARRLELSPSAVSRLLVGLVLLVLVAGLGAGITRDLEVAAGPTVTERQVAIRGESVPAASRDAIFHLRATAGWALVRSVVVPPNGHDVRTADDYVRYVGVDMLIADCDTARQLAGVPLPNCQDGRMYRVDDRSPDPGIPVVPAGTSLTFHDRGGGEVPMAMPQQAMSVDLPPNSGIGLNTILFAGRQSPLGWPDETTFDFILASNDTTIEAFKGAVARLAPAAQLEVANENLDALDRYRIQRGALTFGVWAGFMLGCLAFVIAMVDRAVDRRRDVVSLAVLGMTSRSIRFTQLATMLLPLVAGLGLAAVIGNLTANALLRLDGRQFGWYQGSWRLSLVPVAVGLLLAVLASFAVPGRRPRAEDLRRE
jgi:hypothetical protein